MSQAKPKPRKPTLKMSDLARMAGVSKATVSRALNNSELINAETREKIQNLARQHNYRLNTQARNFRLKESLTIAVVIPSADEARWQISDPFFLELLGAISERLIERGHEMLLSGFDLHAPDWSENAITKVNCDGMIVIGQADVHDRLNRYAADHDSLVVWGAPIEGQNYCSVGGDNPLGGELATRHLLDQGCRRIALIGNWEVPEGQLRYDGYRRALRAARVKHNPALEFPVGSQKDAGFQVTEQLLASGEPFDAIFALSDTFAMTAINALAEHGRKVPDDVAVVGYDDISLARYYTPSITSVHQDREVGGQVLVDTLLQILAGEKATSTLLPTELVVRNSSKRQ